MALREDTTAAFAYTLDQYASLLVELLDEGYEFVGFEGEPGLDPGEIALRHDVDLSLERALAMARVEADLGVRSTYCPLPTASVYNLLAPENRALLRELTALGHDVGLHFNVRRHWEERPSESALAAQITQEREHLARVVERPVGIVSFHRPPDWVLGESFGGFEHAYQPEYFLEVDYISDSNQKWRDAPPLGGDLPEAAQILVHPGLWGETDDPLDSVFQRTKREARAAIDSYVDPMGKWLHRDSD